MGAVSKPATGPMSFDACMAREWPGVDDKAAFCATLERGELKIGKTVINLQRVVEPVAKIRLSVIAKNEEKRLVTAWASVVSTDKGEPIVDAQGDVILIGDLEHAVNKSFADGGRDRGKVMHEGRAKADIVQFFTISKAERVGLGFGEGREGLIVKFRINDDATWEAVKQGALPELSIGGEGGRTEV